MLQIQLQSRKIRRRKRRKGISLPSAWRGKNAQLRSTRGESLSHDLHRESQSWIGGAGRDLWGSPSPAKGTGDTGGCAGGLGMSAKRETSHPPWAAAPELCHPSWKEVLPHVEMELVFNLWPLLVILHGEALRRAWPHPLTPLDVFIWNNEISLSVSPSPEQPGPAPSVSAHHRDVQTLDHLCSSPGPPPAQLQRHPRAEQRAESTLGRGKMLGKSRLSPEG